VSWQRRQQPAANWEAEVATGLATAVVPMEEAPLEMDE